MAAADADPAEEAGDQTDPPEAASFEELQRLVQEDASWAEQHLHPAPAAEKTLPAHWEQRELEARVGRQKQREEVVH